MSRKGPPVKGGGAGGVAPVVVCNTSEAEAARGFQAFTLLVVVFPWSPSSRELYANVREVEAELDLDVRVLDGDTALAFCSRNGILAGAGGLKLYDEGGRECVIRRPASGSSVYTITYPLLRPSQIKELVAAVAESRKTDTICTLPW